MKYYFLETHSFLRTSRSTRSEWIEIRAFTARFYFALSRSTRSEWIEMLTIVIVRQRPLSRSTRSEWIDITVATKPSTTTLCLAPHGTSGLKCWGVECEITEIVSRSTRSEWIEILLYSTYGYSDNRLALHGVSGLKFSKWLPSRNMCSLAPRGACGLKFCL